MESSARSADEKDVSREMERLNALLQGGTPTNPVRLPSRQLKSLSAFCDTFIPCSEAPVGAASDVARYYGTSASMASIPQLIGALISTQDLHPSVPHLRIALWLLSTWYGTLAICGGASLSGSFPYARKFSDVGEKQRERILLRLSRSPLGMKRALFHSLRVMTLRVYFQKADEKNENPSWKGIGYCGPDPAHSREPSLACPLSHALVDFSSSLERPPIFKKICAPSSPVDGAALTLQCDAVVIGSGSGGSVVAGVLARAGYCVVVLEKGSYFPAGSLSLLEGPSHKQMYEKGGMICSDDLAVLIQAGATVGGGSTVNWAASLKTPDHVLEEWRDEHGLKLFGESAFREALEVVCARMGASPSASVGTTAEGLPSVVLRRGCDELGYRVNAIPVNASPGHDCGWCHFGCKDGKKKSTPQTWLADMAESGNGVVLAGCHAVKITTERQKGRERPVATGVIAKFKHGRIIIKSRVTVAACGALNTPNLLRRSGLKNPNIGRHLRIHSCVMAWGYFPEDDESSRSWLDPAKKSYTGELLTTMTAIPGDSKTDGVVIQAPVLHPGAFSAMMPWISSGDFRRRMVRFSRTVCIFAMTRDRGSGCARYYPKSLTYELDARDEKALQRGTERILRILAAAGAEEIGTHHRGGEVFRVKGTTREEMDEYVKRAGARRIRGGETVVTGAHQMGSCRMGKEKKTSVVDEKGETWEVERLFVADSSVFPTALGVNPMVTVQAVAYCTAQNVLNALEADLNDNSGGKIEEQREI